MTIEEACQIVYTAMGRPVPKTDCIGYSREHGTIVCPTSDTEAGRAEAWRMLEWAMSQPSIGRITFRKFQTVYIAPTNKSEQGCNYAEALLLSVAAAIEASRGG